MRVVTLILVAALLYPWASTPADEPQSAIDFVGRTEAAVTMTVRSQVTGYLTHLAVRDGDSVTRGTLLMEIDRRPYELELEAAEARVKVAEARLDVSKLRLANVERLLKEKAIRTEELAIQKAETTEAEAMLTVAETEAEQAELTLSWTRLTAPVNGHVSFLQVAEGDLVVAGETYAMTIIDNELRVSFDVPVATLLRLHRPTPFRPEQLDIAVRSDPEEGFVHPAKLDTIAPEADFSTGTVRFSGSLPNPRRILVPGMKVTVRLIPPPE